MKLCIERGIRFVVFHWSLVTLAFIHIHQNYFNDNYGIPGTQSRKMWLNISQESTKNKYLKTLRALFMDPTVHVSLLFPNGLSPITTDNANLAFYSLESSMIDLRAKIPRFMNSGSHSIIITPVRVISAVFFTLQWIYIYIEYFDFSLYWIIFYPS